MLDYTSLHIICDKCELYRLSLLYMITTTCIYAALCKALCCFHEVLSQFVVASIHFV